MNILVTGAGGFIGQRLCARLCSLGHSVSGLSLKDPGLPIAFKIYYTQDIRRPFEISQENFDLVIHLAAYNITNVGVRDEALYDSINIGGTRNLLDAVRASRWIYLSTVKVYKNEGRSVSENSPLEPQAAYEQSKLKAEEIFREKLGKEALVVLRAVNVIGWGQAPKAVLPVFFQRARHNQPLEIINADQRLQFVYVEDLIDALEALIRYQEKSGTYNIAHPQAVRLEELARKIIALTNSSSALNIENRLPAGLFSPVSVTKAFHELGWKAKTGLTSILELYAQAYASTV